MVLIYTISDTYKSQIVACLLNNLIAYTDYFLMPILIQTIQSFMKNLSKLFIALFFVAGSLNNSSAQTIEMGMVPDSSSALQFNYNRFLISDSDLSAFSGNYDFRYRHALNSKFNLLAELNFSHYDNSFAEADNALGNLFLGAQYKLSQKANKQSSVNFGLYIPTAGEEAVINAFTNIYDIPKYYQDVLTIHGSYSSFFYFDSGFRVGIQLGSDLSIPTEDDAEAELFAKYGLSVMYTTEINLYFQSEFLGYAIITEDDGFGDNSFHSYSFAAGHDFGSIRLAAAYKNYFDDLFIGDFNGVFGLQLMKDF